mmetsp:Transcript_12036/g.13273  ORF Transcript_12036/g.13273 Transcript_12036/m.13273 type:complete len:366 (+) Transcript_12036:115-1212(+)|eukprot:CAMPEP_0168522268 /NCGR_PEP_ID=MMETSP0405-20121227/9241_1 /TAXON_ID=498012 /ORGANISM="Trichosphaerium sp, Strain Am-I-7 wt" /LENGTH=365 /DNA_ID=CAMNT_0008543827 /DNA_START=81 /DNA_END=1178 /DNA_ORIENTATION=+
MGVCLATSATPHDIAINKAMRRDKKERDKTVRILLLGAGDSGKSTFLKQMKCAHANLSLADFQTYRRILRDNLIDSARDLFSAAQNENIKLSKPTKKTYTTILAADTMDWTGDTIEALAAYWKDPGIKKVWREYRLEYHLLWCTDYLFKHVERIGASNFRPTEDDIFRARLKTTGVKETTIQIKGINICFIDVGGQRSERRKWLGCFDNVDAIIYLVALDEYNMSIEENNTTNRLDESLQLLEQVSGCKALNSDNEIPFIIFLNKFDLFRTKSAYVPLSDYFPEYKGDQKDWRKGVRFIGKKVRQSFKGAKLANTYVTCGLDTRNCARVFKSIYDEILLDNVYGIASMSSSTRGSVSDSPSSIIF